jgi:SAM-dependent methyltransferase
VGGRQDGAVPYDPTIYLGSAPHYSTGRPPYSRELAPLLARLLGLDGTGRLLDVGCGPGVLAVELASLFAAVVALDPDAGMLEEGRRRATGHGVTTITWVRGVAEDLARLVEGPFRLVTFGQSFQWTERERVAEMVFDLVEPGGAIACLAPTVPGRPRPAGPGEPPIPHDEIGALLDRYLGSRRRAGRGFRPEVPDRYEDALARTRFGRAQIVFAPGRPDVVRDVDGVIAGYLSMSYAAPHLFGDRLDAFVADMRSLLEARSPSGRFWDWPGDTEIVIARKSQTLDPPDETR